MTKSLAPLTGAWKKTLTLNDRGIASMQMMLDGYEFRYEQTGDKYRLQGFYGAPRTSKLMVGTLDERPTWLVQILDVAAVAGVIRPLASPPDVILWFRTDKEYNLTEYVNT